MIILLSPSKKLDESDKKLSVTLSQPVFLEEAQELIDILHNYSPTDISKLMKVSDNIAKLNVERYHSFSTPFSDSNSKAALYLFKGDVYDKMDTASYGGAELTFADKHLRILSGLYGLLKPLDRMQPYRLEMGIKLENEQGKNLYDFWGDKITESLNDSLEKINSRLVVNLASTEYFKAIKPKKLDAEIITCHFKEPKDGGYKVVGIFAKRARGMMADFIIKNKITEAEVLKSFNIGGYKYRDDLSNYTDFVFVR